ncbi:hypothetical protein DFS33DRAFT_1272361 [Desarmillaria ectypa]|nr:hypothetical protein DFS33DRAFT_1272361 [Desarmillaria ectypa]
MYRKNRNWNYAGGVSVNMNSLAVWKYSNDYQKDSWYINILSNSHYFCNSETIFLILIGKDAVDGAQTKDYLVRRPSENQAVPLSMKYTRCRRGLPPCWSNGAITAEELNEVQKDEYDNHPFGRSFICVLDINILYQNPPKMMYCVNSVYDASLFGLLNAWNDIQNGTPNSGYSSNEIQLSLARSSHAPIQSIYTHSVEAKPRHIIERSSGQEHKFESTSNERSVSRQQLPLHNLLTALEKYPLLVVLVVLMMNVLLNSTQHLPPMAGPEDLRPVPSQRPVADMIVATNSEDAELFYELLQDLEMLHKESRVVHVKTRPRGYNVQCESDDGTDRYK